MLRFILLLLIFTNGFSAMAQPKEDKAIKAVKTILEAQKTAWNKGDLTGFMDDYWNSDELQFISSSGVTKGWQATMERYQKTYPDKAAMGSLEFEVIGAQKRSNKLVTLTGKYILTRDGKNLVGYFLLVWQKIKGRWLIVMDSTN